MFGIIVAIISGLSMTVQGIFNTELNKKIGIWETTSLVQGIAFFSSLKITIFYGTGNYYNLINTNKLYLVGGLLGVLITFTVIKSISLMGPVIGISIILVSQLLSASIINALGLFNTEKITFSLNNYLGIALMIIGIIVFKLEK